MLESLTIRNYAIIDEMTAEFAGGLNVITGETGAGKSIVVDALELVLGARASADMIRAGASSLEVSGVFTSDKTIVESLLSFDAEEGTLILRREVRSDGNNRCFVNDRPVTLRILKELGNRLVDFHGQHDHQSLLDVSEHVSFLNGYGGLVSLANDVGSRYGEMLSIRGSVEKLKNAVEAARRDNELYTFQLEEIDRAKITPGEDNELDAAIKKLARAGELKALGWRIFQELSDAEGSVAQRLGELAADVEDMSEYDNELAPHLERMAELVDGVEDVARFFRGYADSIDDDPDTLAEMEERLVLIERLKKKYGRSLEDVFEYREKINRELESAGHSGEELAGLESKLKEVESRLAGRAHELSVKRKKAAPRLAKEVESHLAELGMSGAQLIIDIQDCEGSEKVVLDGKPVSITDNGFDRVEFLISANPGEPPRPLVKVASGGEISRIMLSLKLTLMDANRVPTMIFDEIDVGVSGRVAESVGKKLLKLTGQRQALVITHLPQIAVMAERHFSARKRVIQDRTLAGLKLLDDKMRQREIASLLSGETLTDTALAHAKELMEARMKRKA